VSERLLAELELLPQLLDRHAKAHLWIPPPRHAPGRELGDRSKVHRAKLKHSVESRATRGIPVRNGSHLGVRCRRKKAGVGAAAATDANFRPGGSLLEVVAEVVAELVGADV